MTLPRVVQLAEFSSGELFELDPLADNSPRPAGTYTQIGEIRGNSVLSSVFVESIDVGATLKINYYDTTTGAQVGERFELTGHDLITDAVAPLTTLRILVTRIHHRVVAEAVVTGGSVKFSLYATVVSSTASDLDSALKEDGTVAVLASDKGLPAMGLGDDGEYHFLPIEGGALKITGTVSTSQLVGGKARAAVIAAPGVEQAHVFAAGTRKFMIKARTPGKILLSFAAGDIAAGDYITVHPGAFYLSEEFTPSAKTIYFQSGVGGLVVELESWA